MAGGGVASVIEGVARPGAPASQQTLMPLPDPPAPRGRGQRGPNRNTKQTRDWILSRYDNPLEGMVAMALPADLLQIADKARALASAMRCSVREAVELMLKASIAANPYLNSAMPQDLNINSKSVALHIGMGTDGSAGGLGELRAELLNRARTASPEGARMLQDLAGELPEQNPDNSGS